MKTIFTNEFATNYSWKGQKEKKKLENYKIFRVILSNYHSLIYYLGIIIINVCYLYFLGCVGKKFPNSEDYKTDAISSIMNWFAQAPTRIIR